MPITGEVAKLGGRNGRLPNEGDGYGPGKGQTRVSGALESDGLRQKGGGGGYGSPGEFSSGGFGESYGSASLAHLHGGSSGGSGQWMGSGAGGGAISLEAHGDGNVTIQSGVTVSANGSGTNQSDTVIEMVVADPVVPFGLPAIISSITEPFPQKEAPESNCPVVVGVGWPSISVLD